MVLPYYLAVCTWFRSTRCSLDWSQCLSSVFLSVENFYFEKYINHFQQLEQLYCNNFSLRRGETCLSLPNLKVLSLFSFKIPGTRIRLELPSMYKLLTNLDLSPDSSVEFAYPLTVTHLSVPNDRKSMARLSNLEYLFCAITSRSPSLSWPVWRRFI